MIEKITSYIEPIITLIIGITIIELILPKNKNRKYVMFTCGLVVMISVINPILKIFKSNIDVTNIITDINEQIFVSEYNSSTNYPLDYNIYNSYIDNLKNNMIIRLEEMGYEVLQSELNVNKESFEPESIELKVKYDDGYIQPIVISVFENVSNEEIAEKDINKIKDFISSDYGIEKSRIKINRS